MKVKVYKSHADYQEYKKEFPNQPAVFMAWKIFPEGSDRKYYYSMDTFYKNDDTEQTFSDEEHSEVVISRDRKDSSLHDILYMEVIDHPVDIHSDEAVDIMKKSITRYFTDRNAEVEFIGF